jgi:hypothetical protein
MRDLPLYLFSVQLEPTACSTNAFLFCIVSRAGLCPWDNLGKANNWHPPPHQYIKFAKKSEALQYFESNEFIELTVGASRVLMSKAATKNICSNNRKHNVNIHM